MRISDWSSDVCSSDLFADRFGYRPDNYYSVNVYDLANIVAHALGDAHPVSPAGVRAALDRIKWLPAASGGPGLMISFGPMVRSAWSGSNYIVFRKLLDADGDLLCKPPSESVPSQIGTEPCQERASKE